VKCLETVKSYDEQVPTFLRNRPPFFLEHCLKRLPTVSGIQKEHTVLVAPGNYRVQRPEQDKGHYVYLHSPSDHNVPFCDCADWKRHCIPCKHILAVITFADGCNGWNSLPLYYRHIPQFNLDPQIAPTAEMQVPTVEVHSDTVTASDEHVADTELPPETASYIPSPSLSTLQSKVRQSLHAITELTYVTDDRHFLQSQLEQLRIQLKEFKDHSSTAQKKTMFRIGRRTVRKNIRASRLRQRLAAIQKRRAATRKRRILKKSRQSGYIFY